MTSPFIGTGVAIVTPFHKQGNVDFCSMEKVLSHLLEGGVDYIVVLGTTGESVTLSARERASVVNFVVDTVAGRVPLVLCLSGNATLDLVELIKQTDFEGFSAIMSVAPYYNKPTQKGIYAHFKNIATASPLPVILYNVPGRTASNIAPETCLQLAEDFPNIIGIKEASGNMLQCMEILRKKPSHFHLISGEDALTLPLIAAGASGVISVTANAFPKQVSEMVRYCIEGNFKKALLTHNALLPVTNMLFEEGNPAGIKAALSIMNLTSDSVRLPLVKASKPLQNRLKDLLSKF